jgi:hypothetical protein
MTTVATERERLHLSSDATAADILRARTAEALMRADTNHCWNCGCPNVAYCRYGSEQIIIAAERERITREVEEAPAWGHTSSDHSETPAGTALLTLRAVLAIVTPEADHD